MSMLPGALRAEHAKPRHTNDWYVEPASAVHSLFDVVQFSGAIHDPACGCGTIPETARARGYRTTGSDLIYRGWGIGDCDFLTDETIHDNIVTNPPYKLAEEFVRHGLEVSTGRVAVLVRISFLAGQRRRKELFEPWPPEAVVVLSARPSMPPGELQHTRGNGTADYCWVTWYVGHIGGLTKLVWA
jgi:hypothetical protein